MSTRGGVSVVGYSRVIPGILLALLFSLTGRAPAEGQRLPTLDVVIGNNFGHLPMFVGVDREFFKKHGVDVRLKVVSTGSDMVAAMQKREVQIGDMSVTMVLERVPEAYVVLRGGGHLTYVMLATAHEPTLLGNPRVVRDFIAGLAAASQYTRQHRDEAVDIFARWVPNVDMAIAKKAIQHIRYDPRISKYTLRAFEEAQAEVLRLTLTNVPARLSIPEQFNQSFLEEVQRRYPQYFSDLPPLPADAR